MIVILLQNRVKLDTKSLYPYCAKYSLKCHVIVGSEAVLGPQIHSSPPPIEQRVGRQRLRPGSGFLSVRVTTDGPTRVLQVLDIKERVNNKKKKNHHGNVKVNYKIALNFRNERSHYWRSVTGRTSL